MHTSLQKATLEEIRNAAARICRDYLTGRWKTIRAEELIVKRISGGLSNFLYYVSLPEQADDEYDVTATSTTVELSGNNPNRAVATEIVSTTDVIASAMATSVGGGVGAGVDGAVRTNIVVGAYDKNSNGQHAIKRHQIEQQEQQQQHQNEQQQQKQQQHDIYGAIAPAVSCGNANIGVACDLATEIATKSHKRQRIDSDSGDSSSSKRLQAMKQEPREVLLRIYGQTHGDDALEGMITESVVFALLSERNFGPKLYGIFPGGRIEQYIPARSLTTVELSDHRLSMKIAEKMGEIHTLNIPMSKEPDWVWNCMKRWLRSLDSIFNESKPNSSVLQKQYELMRSIDYVQEMKWLKSVIDQGDYVVRFCHNDMQEGNILLRQASGGQDGSSPRPSLSSLRSNFDETLGDSLDGNGNLELDANSENKVNISAITSSPRSELDTTDDSALDASFSTETEPDLILIDFEYCAYNYRGFDLANHFAEWSFDYTNPEFPYFYHYKQQTANAQQRRDFVITYLKKYNDDDDYTPTETELTAIDKEIQLFSLCSHLFWSLWSVVNVTSAIEFGYWDYAVARITEYQQLKAAYLAENQC